MEDTATELGVPMKDLTVLAGQNDPYRIDTPARHRDGAWLAETLRVLGLGVRTVHLRGMHYVLIGTSKPDGRPYTNTDEDWTWLQGHAAKAARWLGYLRSDQIIDQRNTEPRIHEFQCPRPWRFVIDGGVNVQVPDVGDLDLAPGVGLVGFEGVQPYKLVMFGEKASLEDRLLSLAERYQADLYLPTGEISDTQVDRMAQVAVDDGRPMVVLCFCDADPAGWQMPVSIGRKLQALQERYSSVEFQVHRVGLTPAQVEEYGLPSTPLKTTERRADKWREEMGVDQTEIDALAALHPDLLERLAEDALERFFDASLKRRVQRAERTWRAQAEQVVNAAIDPQRLETLRAEFAEKFAALRSEITALNEALRVNLDTLDLPTAEVPTAYVDESRQPQPLIDSRWSFFEQCRRMIASKEYRRGEAGDAV